MVAYNYTAPEIQVQDKRRVGVSDPGTGQLQVRAPVVVNDNSAMLGNLASSIANQAGNFATQAFNIQIERDYADGAAEVGITKSEEALQANPLTRDWKVAGFRDATSKYALADAEADFNYNLKQGQMLREKSPAELKAYLQQRRDAIVPNIAGMSGEARTQAMAKLMLMDRSAISQHMLEHTKYVIDYKAQAQGAALNTNLSALSIMKAEAIAAPPGARSEVERVYQDKLESVALATALDIWDDDSLPYEAKQEMTYAALEAALRTDNVDLYTVMDSALTGATALPDARNGISNLTQRLQPEQQNKLANMKREADARNKGLWAVNFLSDWARMDSDMDANTYKGSVLEAEQFLRAGLANRAISGSEFETRLNKVYDFAHKHETNLDLVRAFMVGDSAAIRNMDKTETDAVNAVHKIMRNDSPEVKLRTWMDAGRFWPSAYKEAGKSISQSMNAAMSPNSQMLPQHKESLNAAFKMVDEAESKGYGFSRATMMSGMDDDSKLRFERIVAYMREGQSIEGAINNVQAKETREAGVGPTARVAQAQKLQTELANKIGSLGAIGGVRSWGLSVSSLWNEADAARLKASPTDGINTADGIFSTSDTVRFYETNFRDEVRAEARHQQLVGLSDNADSIYNRALAGVAARTVKTESGPIFIPRGFDTDVVFGTSGGNVAEIGPAIDRIIHAMGHPNGSIGDVPGAAGMFVGDGGKDGIRYRLQFAQGRIFAQAFDKNGKPADAAGKFITPEMIRQSMGLKARETQQRNSEVYGPGKAVGSIQYNGSNNAAVKDTWMMEFRDNLVAHEGFIDAPKKDNNGKNVIGVGVNEVNPYYPKPDKDGKFSAEQLQTSFIGASNAAAKAGNQIMQDVGLDGKSWFKLFSEMAYQSGNNWLDRNDKVGEVNRTFIAHAQSGNAQNAIEAFKRTKTYYWSGEDRRKAYIQNIENAMKGN